MESTSGVTEFWPGVELCLTSGDTLRPPRCTIGWRASGTRLKRWSQQSAPGCSTSGSQVIHPTTTKATGFWRWIVSAM